MVEKLDDFWILDVVFEISRVDVWSWFCVEDGVIHVWFLTCFEGFLIEVCPYAFEVNHIDCNIKYADLDKS